MESCKAFFSEKKYIYSKEQIKLVETIEIILNDSDVAHTLNSFITHTVTNFEIFEYNDNSSNYENHADPIVKLISKYGNHSIILVIGELFREIHDKPFSFSEVDKEGIFKKTLNLDTSKTFQDTHIPTKVLKFNVGILEDFLH